MKLKELIGILKDFAEKIKAYDKGKTKGKKNGKTAKKK